MLKIFLDASMKKVIADELGCSIQFVYRALKGDKETPLALCVRDRAIELGGVKQRRRLVTNGQGAENSSAVMVKSATAS
jgi:hypothetical protein